MRWTIKKKELIYFNNWHTIFAWVPHYVGNGTWAWLEKIERIRKYYKPSVTHVGFWAWEYRVKS